MKLTAASAKRMRNFGVVWIALAPVVLLMAAISTVESQVSYIVQLSAFSTVAAAAIFFGVAAVLQQSWSAAGLFVLSCLGAGYFLGATALILVWPAQVGAAGRIGVALMIAPWGIPFLLMARTIRRLVNTAREETVASTT